MLEPLMMQQSEEDIPGAFIVTAPAPATGCRGCNGVTAFLTASLSARNELTSLTCGDSRQDQ